MSYPVNAPYFTNQPVNLEASGLFSGPKLMQNHQPAPKGEKRGTFLLTKDDGTQVAASFKQSNFLDPLPNVVIDEEVYAVAEPVSWYWWAWAALPFGLVAVGGLLGGLTGATAAVINSRFVRQEMNDVLKFLLIGGISALAVVAYILLAVLVNGLING